MSLDHHIVTPFTAMLIENAEKDEIMLADQPKDPRKGCCPGQCPLCPLLCLSFSVQLWCELGTQGRKCWQRFDLCHLQSCCCPPAPVSPCSSSEQGQQMWMSAQHIKQTKFYGLFKLMLLYELNGKETGQVTFSCLHHGRALVERNMITDIKCLHFFETFIHMGHARACRNNPAFSQAPQTQDPNQQSFYHMLKF